MNRILAMTFFGTVLCWCAVSAPACGIGGGGIDGDGQTDGDGAAPDGDSEGSSAIVTVNESASGLLNTISGTRDDNLQQLDGNGRGYLAIGGCGAAGLLSRESFEDQSGGDRLVYRPIDAAGAGPAETVAGDAGGGELAFSWSLVFDQACAPLVYRAAGNGYTRYIRQSPGVWSGGPVELPLAASLGGDPDRIRHHLALTGRDGKPHLLFEATLTDGRRFFVDASHAGTGWEVETAEPFDPAYWDLFGLDVGPDGAVHAAYRNEDRHLRYARLQAGAWTREVVIERDNFDTEAAYNASIAVSPDGAVAIASCFIQRAQTGSFRYAELRYNTPNGLGSWQSQAIVRESDGYAGGDGSRYTGDDPQLLFDPAGRPHIVFSDMSSWHTSSNWNEYISGQIRHAVRSGSGWTVSTLYRQPGQTESPDPLHDLLAPTAALSPDGTLLHLAGVERTIDGPSVQYDTQVAIDWQLRYLQAAIAWSE